MGWNCDARLTEQDYYRQNQRIAFRAGYSDAFHSAPMWAGNDRNWHPDEYRTGYDAGAADKVLTIDAEDSEDNDQSYSLETITAAIYKLRADYVANGEYESFQAINAGGCEDFASDVHELVGSPKEDANYQMIDPAYFLQAPAQGDDNNYGYPLDRGYLQARWPSVVPPAGLDWDDLDHISSFSNFFSGTHIWIYRDGKHYDAEAPEGVSTPFELPFFQRIIGRWIEAGKPQANPLPAPGM